MVPGTILFDPKFRFHDGKLGPKLFVVLNDGRDGFYVCAKTTSQDARYGYDVGCQFMARYPYFYLPKGCCCLLEHTWICLHEYYEFKETSLTNAIVGGSMHRIGVLDVPLCRELQACTMNSEDMTMAQAEILRIVWNESAPKGKPV